MGCKIALPDSDQSARVHMVEAISGPIAPIYIGDKCPNGPTSDCKRHGSSCSQTTQIPLQADTDSFM